MLNKSNAQEKSHDRASVGKGQVRETEGRRKTWGWEGEVRSSGHEQETNEPINHAQIQDVWIMASTRWNE